MATATPIPGGGLTAGPMPVVPGVQQPAGPAAGGVASAFNYLPGTNTPFQAVAPPPYASGGFPDAGHVTISPDILNSMGQYSDAAYQAAQRNLDPQWQQKQASFDQQMVGQGIQPGSQAYNAAFDNFSRSQNDAYAQARNQALTQGLQAQGQAFGQGYQNSSLQNALANAQTAANASMYDASMNAGAQTQSAMLGANASMFNNSQNNQTNQLNDLLQGGLGYGNLQLNHQNSGFNNLLSAINAGNAPTMYNNTLPGQQMANMSSLLGMIPNGQPTPVDVTGAYGLNAGMQNNAYQGNLGQANATNQTEGQLGSAALTAAMMAMMMCSRELKDDQGPVEPEAALTAIRSLPLHRWNYHNDPQPHIGTFAEDFNEALNLPKSQGIQIIDLLGAVLGSIQARDKRLEKLEAA
jgi:hypothetical protein